MPLGVPNITSVLFAPTAFHLIVLSKRRGLEVGWIEDKSPYQPLSLISLIHSGLISPSSVLVPIVCQAWLVLFIKPPEGIQCAYHLLVISSPRSCIIPSWVETCLCRKTKGSLRTGIQVCVSFAWATEQNSPLLLTC